LRIQRIEPSIRLFVLYLYGRQGFEPVHPLPISLAYAGQADYSAERDFTNVFYMPTSHPKAVY